MFRDFSWNLKSDIISTYQYKLFILPIKRVTFAAKTNTV
ncbi:hypothetical protein M090_2112 [Parabacteroides distasonis str. 3776 Po2 i]|uniref:Uncharacterized protein n=1 Tax=Parabacteroides distasonis str. 3776 D15 i TaxID=1339342 RepID=A0AB34L637_PARDI|nr:hypothetical protein M091_1490 [Parabacteroides distasonis str. 3776 D15 i]KDS52391.1 hypothetical protein M090_2112 [Parabacteroides distasonis str. 3776 Po2 i]